METTILELLVCVARWLGMALSKDSTRFGVFRVWRRKQRRLPKRRTSLENQAMDGQSAKREDYVFVLVRSLEYFEMCCRSVINSNGNCECFEWKFGRLSWCTLLYHWRYWACTFENRCKILGNLTQFRAVHGADCVITHQYGSQFTVRTFCVHHNNF